MGVNEFQRIRFGSVGNSGCVVCSKDGRKEIENKDESLKKQEMN